MAFAPVLQDVAARMSGVDPQLRRDQPEKWAYALREAVSLVRPDWVVTHHDLDLEAEAAADGAEEIADVADVRLEEAVPATSALELTQTLAGLYPSGVVAASVTGPGAMATRLAFGRMRADASEADLLELLDLCGDALAELAAAHVERGAQRVIVWEPSTGPYTPKDVALAQAPIVRRLGTLGIRAILCAGEGVPADAFAIHASPSGGEGAVLLAPGAFAAEAGNAGEAIALAGPDEVVLTDGPMPENTEMAVLRQLGERAGVPA